MTKTQPETKPERPRRVRYETCPYGCRHANGTYRSGLPPRPRTDTVMIPAVRKREESERG